MKPALNAGFFVTKIKVWRSKNNNLYANIQTMSNNNQKNLSKNVVFIFIFSALFLLMMLLMTSQKDAQSKSCDAELSKVSINYEQQNLGQDMQLQIWQKIITSWLGQYVNDDVCDNQKLIDFKINELEHLYVEESTGDLMYRVIFDVKPVNKHKSFWMAGNGMYNDGNSWIQNKLLFVSVKQINQNKYELVGLGTAP